MVWWVTGLVLTPGPSPWGEGGTSVLVLVAVGWAWYVGLALTPGPSPVGRGWMFGIVF